MRLALVLLALTATASPALAEGEGAPPAGTDWGTLLVKAIADNGCKMTEAEADKVLPGLGFSTNWTLQVVQGLVAEGRADLTEINGDPVVIVKTEACPT